jgi:membrane-associated phospholipid phosphatase
MKEEEKMNLELVRESQVSLRKPLLLVGLVLIIAAFLPSGMENYRVFLILFASIIPATFASDRSDKSKLAVAVLYAIAFLFIKGLVFEIHRWQLIWEFSHPNGLFGWLLRIDPFLHAIPFNDGMWLRQFKSPELDSFMVPIYVYGFTTPLLVLLVYYVLTHRADKIVHALFAAHAVQYLIMLPFHFWVDGHQVWLVQNIYDGTSFMDPIMAHRSHGVPTIPSLNHVFPSMHSSIATTMIILAWREKSLLLKWTFAIFNVLVIISTIYLGIHWIVDMIAGVLIGWAVVKFADWMMNRKMVQRFISGSYTLVKDLINRKQKKEVYEDSVSL